MLALAKLAIQPNMHPLSSLFTPDSRSRISNNAWPVFASMSWAFVMYIFRWYPETLASSLRSSMVYMYVTLLRSPLGSQSLQRTFHLFIIQLQLKILTRDDTPATRTQITGTHSGHCSYTINKGPTGYHDHDEWLGHGQLSVSHVWRDRSWFRSGCFSPYRMESVIVILPPRWWFARCIIWLRSCSSLSLFCIMKHECFVPPF